MASSHSLLEAIAFANANLPNSQMLAVPPLDGKMDEPEDLIWLESQGGVLTPCAPPQHLKLWGGPLLLHRPGFLMLHSFSSANEFMSDVAIQVEDTFGRVDLALMLGTFHKNEGRRFCRYALNLADPGPTDPCDHHSLHVLEWGDKPSRLHVILPGLKIRGFFSLSGWLRDSFLRVQCAK